MTNSNRNSTQGWILATVTQDFDPATDFFGASFNDEVDYALFFRRFPTSTQPFKTPYMDNLGVAPIDNGTETIESPEGGFFHFEN